MSAAGGATFSARAMRAAGRNKWSVAGRPRGSAGESSWLARRAELSSSLDTIRQPLVSESFGASVCLRRGG
jgi:hypothetical protein